MLVAQLTRVPRAPAGLLDPEMRLDAPAPTVTAALLKLYRVPRDRGPDTDLDRLSNCQTTTNPEAFIHPKKWDPTRLAQPGSSYSSGGRAMRVMSVCSVCS
jgi:hypothetical protein